MSSFWEKVDEELNFKGMPRKELARKANFPDSYISKGIARKSIPSADLAVKIAHVLNVSLEYLLGMDFAQDSNSASDREKTLLHKYSGLIDFLESTDDRDKQTIYQLMEKLAAI